MKKDDTPPAAPVPEPLTAAELAEIEALGVFAVRDPRLTLEKALEALRADRAALASVRAEHETYREKTQRVVDRLTEGREIGHGDLLALEAERDEARDEAARLRVALRGVCRRYRQESPCYCLIPSYGKDRNHDEPCRAARAALQAAPGPAGAGQDLAPGLLFAAEQFDEWAAGTEAEADKCIGVGARGGLIMRARQDRARADWCRQQAALKETR